jgi:WD40 repeat protein
LDLKRCHNQVFEKLVGSKMNHLNPDQDPEEQDDGDDEDGEFVLNEDDMIEIGDDEEYVPPEGEDPDADDNEGVFDHDQDEADIVDDSVQVFTLHGKDPVYSVAVSHTGEVVASGGGDDRTFVWDASVQGSSLVATHTDSVVSVAFSADDEWIASGGMDGVVYCVNIKTKQKYTLEGPGSEIEWIAWHPKHLVLVAGSMDTTSWMWNIAESGSMMGVFVGHTDGVTCGGFTPNGRRIITGSLDGTLKLWDPSGVNCLHTFGGHGFHEGGVVTFAAKEDDPIVATGGSDGTVCLVRLDTKKIIAKFRHGESTLSNHKNNDEDEDQEEEVGCSVENVAFCTALPWLVSGGTDGRVVVWDLSVQAKRSVLVHPDEQAVVRTIFLRNSVILVTACADGKVRKWDARATHLERTFTGHRDAILDMAVTADCKKLITASDDGTCRVFVI